MRIATWNVNSVLARLPRLLEWLEQAAPDVVCLQETKVGPDAFPADAITELGYEIAQHGEGRWNGVADLVEGGPGRRPAAACPATPASRTRRPWRPGPSRPPAARCGCGRCTCPTGAPPTTRTTPTSCAGWPRCAPRSPRTRPGAVPFAVMGDFNVAPADDDVWDPAAFVGSTHVTPAERAAAGRAAGDRADRRGAADREGPAPLHLLGLPGRRVPQGHGDAHRPGVRQRGAGRGGVGRRGSTARPARARAPATTPRSSSTSASVASGSPRLTLLRLAAALGGLAAGRLAGLRPRLAAPGCLRTWVPPGPTRTFSP